MLRNICIPIHLRFHIKYYQCYIAAWKLHKYQYLISTKGLETVRILFQKKVQLNQLWCYYRLGLTSIEESVNSCLVLSVVYELKVAFLSFLVSQNVVTTLWTFIFSYFLDLFLHFSTSLVDWNHISRVIQFLYSFSKQLITILISPLQARKGLHHNIFDLSIHFQRLRIEPIQAKVSPIQLVKSAFGTFAWRLKSLLKLYYLGKAKVKFLWYLVKVCTNWIQSLH